MADFLARDTNVMRGDSITAGPYGGSPANSYSWYGAAPLFMDSVAAQTRDAFTRNLSAGARIDSTKFLADVSSLDLGAPLFVNQGTAGDTTTDLVSSLATRIYAFNPENVIIALETNDVTNGMTNALFRSNVQAARNGIWANCPRLRNLMWVMCACIGEAPFGTNAWDTIPDGLADKDQILRDESLLGGGFELVETRTDASGNGPWKDYETIHNPGGASSGFLTVDGRHLTAAGAAWQSALVLTHITMVV